jgi:hypothetical protein
LEDLEARTKELLNCPPMSECFPVHFKNGVALTNLTWRCNKCRNELSNDCVFGRVNIFSGRVAVIDAAAACEDCRLVTVYNYRFRDDQTISVLKNGVWTPLNSNHTTKNRSNTRSAADRDIEKLNDRPSDWRFTAMAALMSLYFASSVFAVHRDWADISFQFALTSLIIHGITAWIGYEVTTSLLSNDQTKDHK